MMISNEVDRSDNLPEDTQRKRNWATDQCFNLCDFAFYVRRGRDKWTIVVGGRRTVWIDAKSITQRRQTINQHFHICPDPQHCLKRYVGRLAKHRLFANTVP